MQRERIDAYSVARATGYGSEYVAHCRRVVAHAEAPSGTRCAHCTYSGRVGGATCSERPCGLCDATLHSNNTCVDVLCAACAERLGLCVQCGADRELKTRRKPRDFTIRSTGGEK